jgi:hypothetical protein
MANLTCPVGPITIPVGEARYVDAVQRYGRCTRKPFAKNLAAGMNSLACYGGSFSSNDKKPRLAAGAFA